MTSTEMRKPVQAVHDQFMAAFARSDAAGMVAVYTEDAEILPPNSNVVSGRPAIHHAVALDPTLKVVPLEIARLEKELAGAK